MLPGYVPNPVAAALGGGRPIDGGRNFWDGRRIFGDGKTWRGFASGVLAGILIGALQVMVVQPVAPDWLPRHTLLTVVLFSAGALLGDLAKSFFKRRIGKGQGERWPVADQFDLVAGAFLLTALVDLPWLISVITLPVLFWVLVLTPILHKTVNVIGYLAGIKDVPW